MIELPDNEISEVLQRLTRVETKLDLMINAKDVANEAIQETRSIKQRVDKIERIIFWCGTTVVGTLVVGAIALLYKGVGA